MSRARSIWQTLAMRIEPMASVSFRRLASARTSAARASALALVGALLCTACSGPPAIAPPEPTPPSVAPSRAAVAGYEKLDTLMWVQNALERDALCRQVFAQAAQQLERALADPQWSACLEQTGPVAGLPPAIIVDIDETLLDNSAYFARLVLAESGDGSGVASGVPPVAAPRPSFTAWCRESAAGALPGAREFCEFAVSRGVQLFYVSNRADALAAPTRENLLRLGFPCADVVLDAPQAAPGVGLLRLRTDVADKGPRRAAIAATHRVLLVIGDNGGDFSSNFGAPSTAARSEAAAPYAGWWGTRWIMLPNPLYGDWEPALLQASGLSREETLLRKRAALDLGPDPAASAPSGG
ncbi:MAG: 5'-nucleotidase, lipoprotein e(P4) family [Planctomycetota bacterium]